MHTLLQDIRFGLRMLAKSPGFTAVAVVTLAVGIGANSTMFSLVDGLWTRPLPVRDPRGLVWLFGTDKNGNIATLSYPEYLNFREQTHCFTGLIATQRRGPLLSGDGFTESTMTNVVSANYFQLLGINARIGRVFTESGAGSATEPVVVLSHSLWQRRYGGDPSIIGKTVRLNGRAVIVIGVTPKEFRGTELGIDSDLWIPMESWQALSPEEHKDRRFRGIEVVGRLRPGVPLAQARMEVATVAGRLAREYPDSNQGRGATLLTDLEHRVGNDMPIALILMAIVAMVLLIACGNVANLLLARAEARRHEITVRLAVGCARWRLVRQLMTESALIGTLGAGAGLLLATWLIELLPFVLPPMDNEFRTDERVLIFTFLVSAVTVLLFGLAPALHSSRADLAVALKTAPLTPARRRFHARDVLVAAQIALSLVLLAGAGLLIRTFINAMQADLGFQKKDILLLDLLPPYGRSRAKAFYDELLLRLRGLPHVRQACVALRSPLAGHSGGVRDQVTIPGYQPSPQESKLDIRYTIIGPGYFRVLGTHLLRGRDFNQHDTAGGPRAVIINESMARQFWMNENPVGRHIRIGSGAETQDHEIVGVVQDVRIVNIDEKPEPYMYLALGQAFMGQMTLMVETAGDPLLMGEQIRAEIVAVDSKVPALNMSTMSLLVRERLQPQRMAAAIVALLGLIGLVLAAVGLYGVMSYSVTQRTREIGIRMALGAQRSDVVSLVLHRGLTLALAGCAAGMAGAIAGTEVLSALLYGVSPRDPLAFAFALLVMIVVALAAAYIPARRAAKVDPIVALRCE